MKLRKQTIITLKRNKVVDVRNSNNLNRKSVTYKKHFCAVLVLVLVSSVSTDATSRELGLHTKILLPSDT